MCNVDNLSYMHVANFASLQVRGNVYISENLWSSSCWFSVQPLQRQVSMKNWPKIKCPDGKFNKLTRCDFDFVEYIDVKWKTFSWRWIESWGRRGQWSSATTSIFWWRSKMLRTECGGRAGSPTTKTARWSGRSCSWLWRHIGQPRTRTKISSNMEFVFVNLMGLFCSSFGYYSSLNFDFCWCSTCGGRGSEVYMNYLNEHKALIFHDSTYDSTTNFVKYNLRY